MDLTVSDDDDANENSPKNWLFVLSNLISKVWTQTDTVKVDFSPRSCTGTAKKFVVVLLHEFSCCLCRRRRGFVRSLFVMCWKTLNEKYEKKAQIRPKVVQNCWGEKTFIMGDVQMVNWPFWRLDQVSCVIAHGQVCPLNMGIWGDIGSFIGLILWSCAGTWIQEPVNRPFASSSLSPAFINDIAFSKTKP